VILAFQWLYYNDKVYPLFKRYWVVEYIFVFLPYCFRFLTEKTRLRDSLESIKKDTTSENVNFYFYLTWLTKIFYVWAKHYMGFFLNYLRYLDMATEYHKRCVYLILLSGSFATTISIFLHTLRFKGYISGKTSFSIYVVSYLSTFIGYGMIFSVFFQYQTLFLITITGLVLNLLSNTVFNIYQIFILFYFHFDLIFFVL
jgi:hypothetical protein